MSRNKPNDTDVLILCGGQGTRFREVRSDIPKCLAPIRGRAFIDILLDQLISQGFRRFILATGYLGDQVEEHVLCRGDASYIFSKESRALGTAGAIKFAEPFLHSDPFIILNGDSFINYPLGTLLNYHRDDSSDVTVLLSSAIKELEYGKVQMGHNRRVTSFVEKFEQSPTRLTNAGVYCFNYKILNEIPRDRRVSLELDCLPTWVSRFLVTGIETQEMVYDIGTVDRYRIAQSAELISESGQ